MTSDRYVTHVLGRHIRVGDEVSTDDMKVWHEITEVRREDGRAPGDVPEPDSFNLSFLDGSGMVVMADETVRVRRDHDEDQDDHEFHGYRDGGDGGDL